MDSASIGKQQSSVEISIISNLGGKNTNQNSFGIDGLETGDSDPVGVDLSQVYKSLTILGDTIVQKLNELLKKDLPDGIGSLKPEEHTPEATAQRIVDGSTALFQVFAKQNKGLEGEDLLDTFMSTIRGGIKQGYGEASGILGDLGALDIDGVKSGIEETMRLVEEKLKAFEDNYRKSLKPAQDVPATDTAPVDTNTAAETRIVA